MKPPPPRGSIAPYPRPGVRFLQADEGPGIQIGKMQLSGAASTQSDRGQGKVEAACLHGRLKGTIGRRVFSPGPCPPRPMRPMIFGSRFGHRACSSPGCFSPPHRRSDAVRGEGGQGESGIRTGREWVPYGYGDLVSEIREAAYGPGSRGAARVSTRRPRRPNPHPWDRGRIQVRTTLAAAIVQQGVRPISKRGAERPRLLMEDENSAAGELRATSMAYPPHRHRPHGASRGHRGRCNAVAMIT